MKENLKIMLVAVVLITYVGLASVGTAASTPTVSVDPPEVEDLSTGQTFAVDITVAGITINETTGYKSYGLYGWSINLTFNPTIVNVVNVTEGSFLKETYQTIFFTPTKNNDVGYVFAGAVFMPPLPDRGAEGSGVLATLTFNVTGQGMTDFHFAASKINTNIEGNNVAITHSVNDGSFMNTAPSELSIELVIALVAIVATVCILALFFYRRKRMASETSEGAMIR